MSDTPEAVMARAWCSNDGCRGPDCECWADNIAGMDKARAALSAAGYAIVLREPTGTMYEAAWLGLMDGSLVRVRQKLSIQEFRIIIKYVMKAMVAAVEDTGQ